MTSLGTIRREDAAIRKWLAAVAGAALSFEARWTWAALYRVAPDIHRRLTEQRRLFDQAAGAGTPEAIELHGGGMCRGYVAAVQALEAAQASDDAYLLGQDPRTGLRVAIGEHKAAAERVRELHGKAVVWITPDEVAAVLANLESFKPIAKIKQLFPGAEILDVRLVKEEA
jgi:hypothetical protein